MSDECCGNDIPMAVEPIPRRRIDNWRILPDGLAGNMFNMPGVCDGTYMNIGPIDIEPYQPWKQGDEVRVDGTIYILDNPWDGVVLSC